MPERQSSRGPTATARTSAGTIGADAPTGSTDLLPPPDFREVAAWMAFDAADEEQIVKEIVTGDLIDALVYEFGEGANAKRGISYAGINWCVRQMATRGMGAIGIKSPMSDGIALYEGANADGEPIYKAVVVAVDKKYGHENAGMADALRYPRARGGGTYADLMAERKALSKAQRNAKAGLVPEELKAELLEAVKNVQVKRVRTDRQRAEDDGQQAEQGRAQQASAAPPKRGGRKVNPGQIRLMHAKLKEGGGEAYATDTLKLDPEVMLRAAAMWVSGVKTVDRIPASEADQVLEQLADVPALMATIGEHHVDPEAPEHRRASWLLEQLPKLREALGLAAAQPEPEKAEDQQESGGGEQGALI